MNKPKIAVAAGHHVRSRGVVNNKLNLIEYEEARKVVGFIRRELESDYEVVGFYGTISQKIKQLAKHKDLRCLIEVHFNAYREKPGQDKATGSMHLYCPGSTKGKYLASLLQEKVVAALGTDNLGIRKGYFELNPDKGTLPMLCRTRPPAVITESLYMDDEIEASRLVWEKNIHAIIGTAIAEAVRDFLETKHV